MGKATWVILGILLVSVPNVGAQGVNSQDPKSATVSMGDRKLPSPRLCEADTLALSNLMKVIAQKFEIALKTVAPRPVYLQAACGSTK